jgi:hypothetical protein
VAKKRGNPNWGKPEVNTIPCSGTSSFEEIVKKLRLSLSSMWAQFLCKSGREKTKIRNTCHRTCYRHGGLNVKADL